MPVLWRAFFDLKDIWTPTKIALVCSGIKIVLRYFAHTGIALAESNPDATVLWCLLPTERRAARWVETVAFFAGIFAAALLWGIRFI
jgi:peptidoglycan biosynthesis protein MviN/MurJ (putative lipid II flippase)